MVYDLAIIGGGLAGLALAVEQANGGKSVVLVEQKRYPFNKVCGEYISNEVRDYLYYLCPELSHLNLPSINQLMVSAPGGASIEVPLDTGGFGVSRYTLDYMLAKKAKASGVQVSDGVKVNDLNKTADSWEISTSESKIYAKIIVGSFGKHSLLDNKLDRKHKEKRRQKAGLINYIGVKYHVDADIAENRIELHNFKDGYCGISKVDAGKYCMCYLTTADNLKRSGSSVESMEKDVLSKNPYLNRYFSEFKKLSQVETISQIDFSSKEPVERDVLMIGDAAGLITPLCGNGMSMALHAAHLLSGLLNEMYAGHCSLAELQEEYKKIWSKNFSTRLKAGRYLQQVFGDPLLTGLTIRILRNMPFATKKLISLTHGQPFFQSNDR